MESGDVEATRQALAIFDQLGAKPAAALTRQRPRGLGVTQIPPPPPAQPGQATERQMEILRLLVHGRANAEIASELVLSVRTVDHHFSAVLQKLGTSSRRGAGAAAALGIDLHDSARSG